MNWKLALRLAAEDKNTCSWVRFEGSLTRIKGTRQEEQKMRAARQWNNHVVTLTKRAALHCCKCRKEAHVQKQLLDPLALLLTNTFIM